MHLKLILRKLVTKTYQNKLTFLLTSLKQAILIEKYMMIMTLLTPVFIGYLNAFFEAQTKQLSWVIHLLLTEIWRNLFVVITMPIRIQVIQHIRNQYILNSGLNDKTGHMLSSAKRAASIIPAMQNHLAITYANTLPTCQYCLLSINAADNMMLCSVFLILIMIISFVLSLTWSFLKIKTFQSEDIITEDTRFFVQNRSRASNSDHIKTMTYDSIMKDLRLYGKSIATKHWINIIAISTSFICSYLMILFEICTIDLIQYPILFGMYQNKMIFNFCALATSVNGIPEYKSCSTANINIDHQSKSIILKDISYMALLKNVCLEIHLNRMYGISGSNGAGKTLFAKIISQQIAITAGEIHKPHIRSIYLTSHNEISRHEIYNLQSKEFAFIKPHNPSHGQQNALAVQLALESITNNHTQESGYTILILDETLDSMDPFTLASIINMLKSHKITSILISHNPKVLNACDHQLVIENHNVVQIK